MNHQRHAMIRMCSVTMLALVLCACAARAGAPTLVPEPTKTPIPTNTPQPTATTMPSASPVPASPTPNGLATVVPTRLAGADLPQPIVYIDLRQQLARLAPDGTLTELTNEPGNMIGFDISPSGNDLAYVNAQSDGMLLVQSDVQGGGRAELVRGLLRGPLFDPTGAQILFAVDVAGAKAGQMLLAPGVWSIPTSGGEPTQLVENSAPETAADGQITPGTRFAPFMWSPDGKLLLLITSPDVGPDVPAGDIGSVGLSIFDSADSSVRTLIPPGGNPRLCVSPSWAADSASVLCATPYGVGDETPALFRVDLTADQTEDLLLRQSSEGVQIVVAGALSGSREMTALIGYSQDGIATRAAFERFSSDPAQRKVIAAVQQRIDASSIVLWAADGSGAVFSTGGDQPQLLWQPFDGGQARVLVDGYVGSVHWSK